MKLTTSLLQWVLIIIIALVLWFGWHGVRLPTFLPMPGYQVLFFALAFAFMWVKKLRWGVTKPFNCLGCMTGWTAVLIAGLFHTPFWYFYLPAGLFIGSLVDGAIMRYL